MSTLTQSRDRTRLANTIAAERIKLFSVRSTWWTLATIALLGAGLTAIICATNAAWLASQESNESPASFITQGMIIAQVGAVVLGALIATNEYGTGQISSTFSATPNRGRVIVAKALLVIAVLFTVGTATALLGFYSGNFFLEREGVGLVLESGVARSMYGSGLYLAGLGLLSMAVGFIVRHTAAAISAMLALIFVVSNLVFLIPGTAGEWVAKLMPANAGSAIAMPVHYDPTMIDKTFGPWSGYGVFLLETAAVLAVAWVLVTRRDA
ncbi:MAG TPA: ABC transporter permease [Aeromicrobium sp.]|nr:ABC transporter permease [Aeromicrobium sp.]